MNKPEILPQDDVAGPAPRHQTTQVMVGNVAVGGGAQRVLLFAIQRLWGRPGEAGAQP